MHRQIARDRRRDQYAVVVELARQGEAIKAIAKRLRLCEKTVACWLRAPAFPERRLRAYSFVKAFAAGRIAALLANPAALLTPAQREHRTEFLELYPSSQRQVGRLTTA